MNNYYSRFLCCRGCIYDVCTGERMRKNIAVTTFILVFFGLLAFLGCCDLCLMTLAVSKT